MAGLSWVLLVEDDPDHRSLLGEVLGRRWPSVELHEVGGVEDAISWLVRREPQGMLDGGLVLVDLGLPGPSGFTLLEWQGEMGLTVPMVVLTASENPMDADHAFNLGAHGYFQKPTDFHQYAAMLERVFERVSPEDEERTDDGA